MRYVTQLVRWLLRFMDKSSEDRVDAYSAQSAFFIIMGFIPFVMLLLILLQYTPMTKEDVMTLLKVIFPEGFHAYRQMTEIRVVPRKDRFVPILGWSFFILIYKENET